MNKFAIVSDQCSGLSSSDVIGKNIYFVKNPIVIEGQTFYDLSISQLVEAQKACKKITTSMPNIGETIELIEKLLVDHQKIFLFSIPKYLSGFFNSISMMVSQHPLKDRIRIVNISALAYPLEAVLLHISNNFNDVDSVDKYIDLLEKEFDFSCILCPNNLKYLAMGGRVPNSIASLANLLKIVALIEFNTKESKLVDKVRLHKKAYQKAMNIIFEKSNNIDVEYFILKNNIDDEILLDIVNSFSLLTGKKITVREIPPLILAHTGYQSLGFGYHTKL